MKFNRGEVFLVEKDFDVLLVDDDSSFLKQASIFLEEKEDRLNIETFTSAEEALEKLNNKEYFAIVSDYQMPGMDGLDFLKSVREELDCDVPFIILTGKGREEVAMEALNLGADRYLKKSSDPDSLHDILTDAILGEIYFWSVEKEAGRYKQELEEMFDSLREIAFVEDRDHNIIMVNESTVDFLGKSKEELKGKKCYEIFHSTDEPIEDCPLRGDDSPEEVCEVEFYEEGMDKYFLARIYPFSRRDGKERFIHQLIDITDRKKMEEKLRLRTNAIKSSLDGFFVTNLNREVIFVNPSFLEIWKYENENDVIGKDPIEFWEDDEEARKIWEEIKEEGEWRGVLQGERRDGETFPVSISASLVRNEKGEPIGVTSSFEDITEKREVEKREEFLHSLLRHDLRNKLTVMGGYIDLLEDFDFSEEASELLRKAFKANEEATKLIENVRKLREVGEEELKEIEIDNVLGNVVSNFEKKATDKGMDIRYVSCKCKVMGGDLLSEVFSNLVKNSIQHSDGDLIQIQTEDEGDKTIVTVEDDGRGIPDESKDMIFERGYKKGGNAGSGLGMHLVKEIVENYDGKVEVKDSELGGARVDVYLQKSN